jgi:hypothetical protein
VQVKIVATGRRDEEKEDEKKLLIKIKINVEIIGLRAWIFGDDGFESCAR